MRRMRNPNELFVGDLSYFCREEHLVELFRAHGTVVDARIKRSEAKNKTLMYGFVRMDSFKEALAAAQELNGKVFMGRTMKVELSLTNGNNHHNSHSNNAHNDAGGAGHCQLHVAFYSQFPSDAIIEPDEGKLREVFAPFGEIVDIVVKDYIVHKKEQKQEGYGFITFAHEEAAMNAVRLCQNVQIAGIGIQCAISHKGRDHASSDNSSRIHTGLFHAHSVPPLDGGMMPWTASPFPGQYTTPPVPLSAPYPLPMPVPMPAHQTTPASVPFAAHAHMHVMPPPLPLPVYPPHSPHSHTHTPLPSSSRSFSSSSASSARGMPTFRSVGSSQSNADHDNYNNNNPHMYERSSSSPALSASHTHTQHTPAYTHAHALSGGMMMPSSFSSPSSPAMLHAMNAMTGAPLYPPSAHHTHAHNNTAFAPSMGAYPHVAVAPMSPAASASMSQGQTVPMQMHAQPHAHPYPPQSLAPQGQTQPTPESMQYPPVYYWR